ncbi:MAG: glycosyltransferase family 2 protein [Candidatus Marsarchaeota archaeon]|jgi:dolichol-phosphate mannosyltransferase|nr:glycosyltransferase family 2 protein [Candidatus Marsarchaeota archaeon]MCL5111508.1 glycosyltransferase family 2 protein [Candidatus Marsarchaeota archaeon]
MRPRISVVLPTKEEEGAFSTIASLKRMFPSGLEIIVIDKSSKQFFSRIKRTGVRVFRQRSSGVENAMIEGLRKASGSVIASVDADGTHELSGITRGIKLIEAGQADLVLGNRMDGLERGSMSGYLRFGNAALSSIFNLLYGQDIHDVLTGMLIMDRKALDAVKRINPEGSPIAFFQVQIARRGFRLGEVRIRYSKRRYGKSRLAKSKFLYGISTALYMIKERIASLPAGQHK